MEGIFWGEDCYLLPFEKLSRVQGGEGTTGFGPTPMSQRLQGLHGTLKPQGSSRRFVLEVGHQKTSRFLRWTQDKNL